MRRVTAGGPAALQTLLQRSDGEPLLVASQYGRGRVAALLTTVTSDAASDSEGGQPWSNLAGLPLFPVMVQDLVGWLVGGKLNPPCESIGDRSPSASERQALERIDLLGESTPATPLGPAAPLAPAVPGVYRRLDGGNASAPFAALVGAGESDLRAYTPDELRSRTRNVARVGRAEELFLDEERVASREPLEALALLLLALLCVERWLAFRTSYVEAMAGGTP
jgi:hypothetical protein